MFVFYFSRFSMLMMPFSILPSYIAGIIWYLMKILICYALYRWYKGQLLLSDYLLQLALKKRILINSLPFLLLVNSFLEDFWLGQVILIVHFMVLLSLYLLNKKSNC